MRPIVVVDLASDVDLADLIAGGVSVRGAKVKLDQECELVLRAGARELRLAARAVYVDPVHGTGFELARFSEELRQQIVALAELAKSQARKAEPPPSPPPPPRARG